MGGTLARWLALHSQHGGSSFEPLSPWGLICVVRMFSPGTSASSHSLKAQWYIWWIDDVMNWLVGWDRSLNELADYPQIIAPKGTWDRPRPHRDGTPLGDKRYKMDGWKSPSHNNSVQTCSSVQGFSLFYSFSLVLWWTSESCSVTLSSWNVFLLSDVCICPKLLRLFIFPHINVCIPLFSRYGNGFGGENPSFR